jgi:predicted Zn-dependent peptidase
LSAQVHRLANGLTVAVEPMAGVETCAVGLYAHVGSRSEPEGLAGLAHMVEHMVFKGAASRDARAIAEDIEDVGASLNAWTSRDQTVFNGRLLANDLPLGVEIIADLIREPHFDADELEREKSVVLAELGEARDTPDDIIFDNLQATAFPSQVLGAPVLGDEASIAAIDVAAMRGWLHQQYRPDTLVLAAAGKIDENAFLRQIEARFGDMAAGKAPLPPVATFAPGTHHDVRRFDQLHAALAFPGVGYRHPDAYALTLFAGIAGGGASSRLFQEVREKRGLAYSVYAWSQSYADVGVLGIYLAAARRDAGKAIGLARDILAETADRLTEAELQRNRNQAKAGLLMGTESVQARCDNLARGIQIHGRISPLSEGVEMFDAVSVEQTRRAAQEALSGGEALATVGGKLKAAA